MDVPKLDQIDEIIRCANVLGDAGDYKNAIDILLPLLERRNRKKVSPKQELPISEMLASFYRLLANYTSALFHAERYLELTRQIFKSESKEYAFALKIICVIHREIGSIPKAHDDITKALNIMRKLELQHDVEYGYMLEILATIKYKKGQFKKALKLFIKAKPLLVKHKDNRRFNTFLNDMALCHQKLQQWTEATTCFEECIEYNHEFHIDSSDHATTLWNFGNFYFQLGQYRYAIPILEEGISIWKTILGEQHEITIYKIKTLAELQESLQSPHYEAITGYKFKMCSECGEVKENMEFCTGCSKVWYCNKECQLKDWTIHKPECHVCMKCNIVLNRDAEILKCPCCKKTKYCNSECQKEDWTDHQKTCSQKEK